MKSARVGVFFLFFKLKRYVLSVGLLIRYKICNGFVEFTFEFLFSFSLYFSFLFIMGMGIASCQRGVCYIIYYPFDCMVSIDQSLRAFAC